MFFGSSNGQVVPTRAGQNRCWSPSRRGISLIVCAHSVRWQTKVAGKATHQVEFDQQHAGPIPAVVKVTAYLNCGEALALDPIQPERGAVLAVRRHSCDLSVAVR
jgi:hypothetical protein